MFCSHCTPTLLLSKPQGVTARQYEQQGHVINQAECRNYCCSYFITFKLATTRV